MYLINVIVNGNWVKYSAWSVFQFKKTNKQSHSYCVNVRILNKLQRLKMIGIFIIFEGEKQQ